MKVWEEIAGRARHLPTGQQLEVLEFLKAIEAQQASAARRPALKGLWSDLEIRIPDQEIDAARSEAWADFPRSTV